MAVVIAVIYARSSGYKLVEIGQERKKPYSENVAQLTANWSGRGRARTHRAILLPCVDTRVHVCRLLYVCGVRLYRVTRRDRISVKEPEMNRRLSKCARFFRFFLPSFIDLVFLLKLLSSYDCIVIS